MTRSQTGLPGVQRPNQRKWRALFREVVARDGNVCHICGDVVDLSLPRPSGKSQHPLLGTLDHVVALRFGGTNEPDNLKLAHYRCNQKRNNEEHRRRRNP